MTKSYTLFLFLFIASAGFSQNTAKDSIENARDGYSKFRFGGYGEILFQQMNYGPNRYLNTTGAPSDNRSTISLPRVVFATDYKFRNDIILGSEIEFEYGGTGSAMELEYAEAGEYEMEVEQGGEVVLEQLHITKVFFNNKLNLRIGHMIVPVGLTNAHHEPIFYFGTSRPEGETTIIPCTWHETGIALLGNFWDFNYNFMVVNGLDPNGFSTANWVAGGKQGIFEVSTMTNPAFAGRIEYFGVKGLRLGVSGYIGNTAKNASKPEKMAGVKGTVGIISGDAQYSDHNLVARTNFIYGNLSDSKRISQVNRIVSKNIGFPRTEVAKNAMTFSAEVGYNVFALFELKQKLYPFVRYEYYNTMQDVQAGVTEDPRYKRDIFSFGLNYYIIPNLVIKADYSIRQIDGGSLNNENTFGLSVGYTGWFVKK